MDSEKESISRAPDFNPEKCLREHPDLKDELKKLFQHIGSLNETGKAGTVLGDFKIVRELGSGGMATVYEAEQITLQRKVALKVLSSHLSLQNKAVQKFYREAMAGSRQQHPGIVAIYALGEHDGIHYIAEELVDQGRNLANRLEEVRKGPGSPEGYYREIAGMIRDVADALQHAHASGVIHRDIKPPNILLTPVGRPKVSDFGLARIEDVLSLTQTGDFSGTAFYMSPEQITGQGKEVDARTDIYSLGVTLYECLTLKTPFHGKSTHDVLKQIILHEPKDPRKLSPRVPRDLAVICLKAMEKDPRARYPTMRDFAADLDRYLSGRVIQARPAGVASRIYKRVKRHPYLSIAAGIAFAALAFLFVYSQNREVEFQDQAAASKALNSFLQNIVSTPNSGSGDAAADSLEQAADRVRRDFKMNLSVGITLKNTLAMALRNVGMPERAEPILREVLEYRRAHLGGEHLDTNVARNNLAVVLSDLGRLEESEALYLKVLENHRRILGEEHLNTILVMNNLVTLHLELGRFEEVEEAYRALLSMCRRTQGEDHEETMRLMHNLSTVLIRQGKLDEAETLVENTLELRRRVLGPENLDTLKTLMNQGQVLDKQGRYEEAHALLLGVRKTCIQVLGEEHPATLTCLHSLASVLLHQRRLEEAETLCRFVVECRTRKLGADVPCTVLSMNLLAEVLWSKGDLGEAESLFQKALDVQRHVLGDEHPDTLIIAHNLEGVLKEKRSG